MRDADTKKSCAEDGQVGPFHACLAITVVRVRTGAKNGCKLLWHNKSDGQLLVKAFHKKKKVKLSGVSMFLTSLSRLKIIKSKSC